MSTGSHIRVAVNGYGVIGTRVADAVALQGMVPRVRRRDDARQPGGDRVMPPSAGVTGIFAPDASLSA